MLPGETKRLMHKTGTSEQLHLCDLPAELLVRIFSNLNVRSLLQVERTARTFYQVLQSPQVRLHHITIPSDSERREACRV